VDRKRKIRVLVVDDSPLFREAMVRGISADPAIEVVGTASDSYSARDKIIDLEPDVLTLDVVMPKMSGIEFLKKLMPQYPLPVVVVSSVSSSVFDALEAGAVDFVTKPGASPEAFKAFISELTIKIKIATTAKVGQRKKEYSGASIFSVSGGEMRSSIIAIGASTGGTDAIFQVIKDLPRETPGIVVVQHMPPKFTAMYAERLNNTCRMEVKEAENGDEVTRGRVLIAPGDFHMELKRDRNRHYVKCFKGEKVNGHCPSVDVLFNSVAENAPRNSIGIILTGMGKDGAKGLLNMRKKGHFTIGQDEKTCVVYGMPMVAYNIGAVALQAPLDKIGGILIEHLRT
jgi:two-component system chemotaxis response regulator CheB